jgi:hypothetical protein
VKIIDFPDPRLDQFVADVRRDGFAIADLEAPTEVEAFRDAARRALRQLGIRVRTGSGLVQAVARIGDRCQPT